MAKLIPFLSSGLAWNDPRQKDVTCMSDRAMSLLIQECRHMIAREEKIVLCNRRDSDTPFG